MPYSRKARQRQRTNSRSPNGRAARGERPRYVPGASAAGSSQSKVRIYLFSPIPYSYLYQRPQHLADQFHSEGLDVSYIEPCGFSEYLKGEKRGALGVVLRSLGDHIAALVSAVTPAAWRNRRRTPSLRRETFEIVAMPAIIPHTRLNSALLESYNARVYRTVLEKRILAAIPPGENSVAFVEQPFWGRVLEKGDFTRIVYDCLDDLTLFSGRASTDRFRKYQERLVRLSSGIVTTAHKLEGDMRAIAGDVPVLRIPNGVDVRRFRSSGANSDLPHDIREVPPPIAGYVGTIAEWMDVDLIEETAQAMPGVSFVFVGPALEGIARRLARHHNVFLLGRKPHAEIPAYVNAFDVCLIPFRSGSIAASTNPVKLFEYFALRKPVVSTYLAELEPFAKSRLLIMAANGSSFSKAIDRSLRDEDKLLGRKRERVAREHSWDAAARSLLTLFLGEQP